MLERFKIAKNLIILLGAVTVVTAFVHGSMCFGEFGGMLFGFFAAGTLFITYRVFAAADPPHVALAVLVVLFNVGVFSAMASFKPRDSRDSYQLNHPAKFKKLEIDKALKFAEELIDSDPRFEKLSVRLYPNGMESIEIEGTVKTESHLFDLRDKLVFAGIDDIIWVVTIMDTLELVSGHGDSALLNREDN